ncbi:MAG: hypothetical protein B7Y35_06005 [Sphingomonadales bacterium 28-64-96]|nr:MAG: hypothetical protein B7Y35_06005 [Sphingomonadales bacterium 28-64-96]
MSGQIIEFPRGAMTPNDAPGAAGGGLSRSKHSLAPATQIILHGGTVPGRVHGAMPADGRLRLVLVGGVHHGRHHAAVVPVVSCGEALPFSAARGDALRHAIFGGWDAEFNEGWL